MSETQLPCLKAFMPSAQSPYLKEFLAYAAENPSLKPIKRFPARAAVKDKLPQFFRTLPVGDVIIYPKFLIFLTLENSEPGNSLFFKEFVQTIYSEFKITYEIASSPLKLLEIFAQRISNKYQDESLFQEALANSNSIFVPLIDGTISVETGRYISQGCYIKISSSERSIVICQELGYENVFGVFSGFREYIKCKWNEDVVEHLCSFTKKIPHLVTEEIGKVSIIVELPGISKESIDLWVNEEDVCVSSNDGSNLYKKINLTVQVDPKSAKAHYENGKLNIYINKKN